MIMYIADTHFGDRRVLRFDHRPFYDVDTMDNVMTKLWNERVSADDTVYMIGDFCAYSKKPAEYYLKRLKGHKILILGNHDHNIPQDPNVMSYLEDISNLMLIDDNDKKICLCHYPLSEWEGSWYGTWHIYGHIHNIRNQTYEFMRKQEHALNAGCMINSYTPVSLQELIRNNEVYKQQNRGDNRINESRKNI